jgi:energy-converting hydrogenase Eha subunit H
MGKGEEFFFFSSALLLASHSSISRMDLVHMDTSALITFKILKILKSHTSMSSKIMALNT